MDDLETFCEAWKGRGVKPRVSFIESPDFDTMADLMVAERWVLAFFKNGKFVCDASGTKGRNLNDVLPGK